MKIVWKLLKKIKILKKVNLLFFSLNFRLDKFINSVFGFEIQQFDLKTE